ncbi:MAG: hypothetical protein GEV05_23840 [Betaproteobacteria bacterium]|nr:hypothetical protein [Betaproteobacteria bacterium]
MERTEMIRQLVDATIESGLKGGDLRWLREILSNGFPGFGRLTDAGLAREMELRGLLEFDEPEPDMDFDDDPDADEDYDEAVRSVMLSGMVIVEGLDARVFTSAGRSRAASEGTNGAS